jgi:hypothetical protein
MTAAVAQRQIALAGVALLALLIALAAGSRDGSPERAVPRPVAGDPSSWYRALAAPAPFASRSACNLIIRRATLGVAHPVLPCGAKIFVEFGGKSVLTQIIDHAPRSPGVEFLVSPALARRLELSGVQPVRWSFARA